MADRSVVLDIIYNGVDKLSGVNAKIGKDLKKMGGQMTAVGGAMTAAGGVIVGGLLGVAGASARAGDEIAKASDKTGIAVDKLSALRYAARQSGVEFEGLQNGLARMARSASEAADGSEMYKESYDKLGISVTDANGKLKDGNTLFLEISEGLSKVESSTQRAALAQEFFGRSGTQLLPLMKNGSAGIADLQKRAEELGLTWNETAARDAERYNDALSDMKQSAGALGNVIGTQLFPVIAETAESISEAIGQYKAWADEHPTLAAFITKLTLLIGAAFAVGGPILIAIGQGILACNALTTAMGRNAAQAAKTGAANVAAGKQASSGGGLAAGLGKVAGVGAVAYGAGAMLASGGEKLYSGAEKEEGVGAGVKRIGGKVLGSTIAGQIAKLIGGKKLTAKDAIPLLAALEGRAAGGPVKRGQSYIVGEEGPELFTPTSSGNVHASKSAIMRALSDKAFLERDDKSRAGAIQKAEAGEETRLARIVASAKVARLTARPTAQPSGVAASPPAQTRSAGAFLTIGMMPGLVADQNELWAQTPSGERVLIKVVEKSMRNAVNSLPAPA